MDHPFIHPQLTMEIYVIFGSKRGIYDWLPDMKSHLLLCLSSPKCPFFAATDDKTILVFSFISFLQLFLFNDITNIYRVYIASISQTLFTQKSQTTTPVDNLNPWMCRHRRSLPKSYLPSTMHTLPMHQATDAQTTTHYLLTDWTDPYITKFHPQGLCQFHLVPQIP